jgi:hypothetical protein
MQEALGTSSKLLAKSWDEHHSGKSHETIWEW